MRGRKPVPKEIAKIRGYYRPGKHKDQLSMSGLDFVYKDIPEPPEALNKWAKKMWTAQLEEAAKVNGYIAVIDLLTFEVYCSTYGNYMKLKELCISESYHYEDKKGVKRINPLFKECDRAKNTFIKLSAEFGFTPSARMRVKLQASPSKDAEEEDYII